MTGTATLAPLPADLTAEQLATILAVCEQRDTWLTWLDAQSTIVRANLGYDGDPAEANARLQRERRNLGNGIRKLRTAAGI